MSDLISRQAAIDALRVAYWDDNIQSAKDDPCIVDAMTDWAIRQVKALPSAQPERKTGEWLELTNTNHTYVCSVCGRMLVNITDGKNTVTKNYPFCHCGADMRGEKHGL